MSESIANQKFADQAFRTALRQPIHLRSFLRRVVPEIVDRLDFDNARVLDTELPFDDWRNRQCDILVEIPCRTSGGATESILVCVLIEHQSATDERMPLRTLIYSTLYWDRQWREWESSGPNKGPFRLRPLLPIVLHADQKPWRSSRKLADLFDADNPFPHFIPRWEPLFWELASADSDELLNSTEAFDQFLAVVRAAEAEPDKFEVVFRQALEHLQDRHAEQRVVLSDMLRLVFTWATWRRPPSEVPRWKELTIQSVRDTESRREIATMAKSAIEVLYEEAIQIGRNEGLEKGLIDGVRNRIIQSCRHRFGFPNSLVEEAVRSESNQDRLWDINDRVSSASSWEDILKD